MIGRRGEDGGERKGAGELDAVHRQVPCASLMVIIPNIRHGII